MKLMPLASVAAVLAIGAPFAAYAQTVTATAGSVQDLFSVVLSFINVWLVPIVFAIAFLAFLFGVYYYFIQNGGNPEKTKDGRQFVLWSLIGFFIMFSVWGLVNLLIGTLGFNNAAQPTIPTFTNTSGSTVSGGTLPTSSGSSLQGGSVIPATASGCTDGTTAIPGTSNCQVPVNSSLGQGGNCSANGSSCGSGLACNNVGLCEPAAGNSSLGAGGDCSGNENACQTGLTCNNEGLCEPPVGNGTQGVGGDCSGNENACQDGLLCSEQGTCIAIPQDGTAGAGQSCEGNENACQDGLTCDNNSDTCVVDQNVDNSNTTVQCNDGTTQDIDTGCADDCGQVGSADTCN